MAAGKSYRMFMDYVDPHQQPPRYCRLQSTQNIGHIVIMPHYSIKKYFCFAKICIRKIFWSTVMSLCILYASCRIGGDVRSLRSIMFFISSQFLAYLDQVSFQFRQIPLDNLPDLVKINSEVFMGKHIPHRNNLRPWDFGIGCVRCCIS